MNKYRKKHMKDFNITIVLCLAIIAAIFFFPPPQNSNAACNPPEDGESCCGGNEYDPVTQGCCDDVVYDLETQGCCDGVVYDFATQGCCNGVVYDLETQGCCEGVIYDLATQDCCYGVIYDLATQGCCNGVIYNLATQVCCNDEVFDGQCCTNVTTDCFSNGSIDGSITSDSGVGCWSTGGSLLFANAIGIDLGGMLEEVTKNSDCSETTDYVPIFGDVSYTWTISGPDSTNGVGPVASLSTTKAGEYTATFYMDVTNRLCPPETFIASTDLAIVKVDSIDVWDGNDRYAHAVSNILEVVPPLQGEIITCKANVIPDDIMPPSGCLEWTIAGYWSSVLYGQQVTFRAANYVSTGLWLFKLMPHTYTIDIHDQTCTVRAFTNRKAALTVGAADIKGFLDAMESLGEIQKRLKAPVDVKFKPSGSVSFENQWVESSGYLAHYTWTLGANVQTDCSLRVKLGTGLAGLPPQLAELAIFIELKGALGVAGSASLDSAGNFKVSGGAYGSVTLTGGGTADIASGFLDVEISAGCSVSITADFVGSAPDPKVYSEIDINAGKLALGYKVESIWGLFSSEKSSVIWEGHTVYDDTVQIVPW